MAVRKAGLGKGLDSLIPEHSVRRKAEKIGAETGKKVSFF